MAVLGLWNHSVSGLSCVGQYFVEEPVYFQMTVKSKSRTNIEKKFLHVSERGEIYAFSGDENHVTLSFIKLDAQPDLKRFRKLPYHS